MDHWMEGCQEGPSREDNVTPRPYATYDPPTTRQSLRTPEPTQTPPTQYQPPDAPVQRPPKFPLRRRRVNSAWAEQLRQHFQSEDQPVPSIELSTALQLDIPDTQRPMTPIDTNLLSPSLSTRQLFSPPKTPVAQIRTSFDTYSTQDRAWTPVPQLDASFIERPSSALSVMSDSSASSASSSETSPSYGGSCTSPESDSADPFSFPESFSKRSSLDSPVEFKKSSKPRKRLKTSSHTKWTPEMDEHLWVVYLAYQTNPEVTPFKALPGVAPPLGVCHRVAREAKRSWKGPRIALNPISENAQQSFESIDSIVRETSAPPEIQKRPSSPALLRLQANVRSHSSTDVSRRAGGQWPRSEASTRRRLRELCKSKPNLPAHYQRLMQTRSPSPFGSSSSTLRRSSRLSPSPKSQEEGSSSFATDDLKLSLTAHTMSSMQPGNALYQLASEPPVPTPYHHYNTWSSSSASRSGHQKSQSLPHGPASRHTMSSRQVPPLASPFHAPEEDRFINYASATPHLSDAPSISAHQANETRDPPWQIHAPRPMSGSMKRRADFDLGEDLVSPNLENSEEMRNIFPSYDSLPYDGKKRARVRGFSMGAMRHASGAHQRDSTRQLTELFNNPAPEPEIPAIPATYGPQVAPSVGNMVGMGRLAPPSSYRPPRLASPFAPAAHAPAGFSNTFPRNLFPHGLNSIASMEQHRPHSQLQSLGSDGSYDANDDDPFITRRQR